MKTKPESGEPPQATMKTKKQPVWNEVAVVIGSFAMVAAIVAGIFGTGYCVQRVWTGGWNYYADRGKHDDQWEQIQYRLAQLAQHLDQVDVNSATLNADRQRETEEASNALSARVDALKVFTATGWNLQGMTITNCLVPCCATNNVIWMTNGTCYWN